MFPSPATDRAERRFHSDRLGFSRASHCQRFARTSASITLALPHLVIDFEQLTTMSYDELKGLTRVASLDSPFAEAVVARFTRHFGRIGLPDLNVEGVIDRLRAGIEAAT